MCFIRACNTGLTAHRIMLRLSHHTTKGLETVVLSSPNKEHNHVISTTMLARLLNLASIEDLEIICCFLVNHDTRLEPK